MDTSGDVCSVGVLRDGILAEELAFRHEMHLSERLVATVDLLLKGAGCTIEEIDCFAVGTGPGSFTGTRIGVMTMKTFAYIQEKPIAAINSLEIVAAEYCGVPGVTVTPVLSCRSGVVYACPFATSGDRPIPLADPGAFTFEELAVLLQEHGASHCLLCGAAAKRYEQELRSTVEARNIPVSLGSAEFPRASLLGRLAAQRLASGDGTTPLEVTPLYISPPPITLPKQPIPT